LIGKRLSFPEQSEGMYDSRWERDENTGRWDTEQVLPATSDGGMLESAFAVLAG
jgi:hypothetical protein